MPELFTDMFLGKTEKTLLILVLILPSLKITPALMKVILLNLCTYIVQNILMYNIGMIMMLSITSKNLTKNIRRLNRKNGTSFFCS
jgi:hypothetical protein